jgi:hypothetical protein
VCALITYPLSCAGTFSFGNEITVKFPKRRKGATGQKAAKELLRTRMLLGALPC